ncbi:MAG TPA: RHS repeat-associated core domain-containing protein, partial [Pyrinomonadaceae bacterium]|nr:RHS repeat-associated core domain-containing protein [Pyrinomonadaceae bacterium]
SNNRITGSSYDAAGNLLNDGTHSYAYDGENKISKVDNVNAYVYDGEGQRVRKLLGENLRFVYGIGGQLIMEFNGATGALAKEYVYGAGGLLATIEPTAVNANGTRYTTSDHLGSPRVVTNSTAGIVSRHDYMPFGEELGAGIGGRTTGIGFPGTSDGIRQKFTAYERDVETGLDFAQARYYSSSQGRFTRPDPYNILFEIESGRNARERAYILRAYLTEPQNWNRYNYCLNNPVNLIDPSGLIWLTKDDQTFIWIDDEEYNNNKDSYGGYSVANGAVTQYQGSSDCPQCQGLSNGDWIQLKENGDVVRVPDPTAQVVSDPNDPASLSGYTDVNISFGSPYFIGVTGGLMFDRQTGGTYPYLGGGFMTPGPSSTVTYSPDSVSGGFNVELQGAYGMAGAVGLDQEGNSFTSLGGGSPGASATAYYVFFAPHPKRTRPYRPTRNDARNYNMTEKQRLPKGNCACSW